MITRGLLQIAFYLPTCVHTWRALKPGVHKINLLCVSTSSLMADQSNEFPPRCRACYKSNHNYMGPFKRKSPSCEFLMTLDTFQPRASKWPLTKTFSGIATLQTDGFPMFQCDRGTPIFDECMAKSPSMAEQCVCFMARHPFATFNISVLAFLMR